MNSQIIGYPILSAQQKKELDKNTIISEPIPSNDLLERACYRMFLSLKKIITIDQTVDIICGQGNNGADGLCLARIMAFHGYKVCIYKLNITDKYSVEYAFQNDLLLHTQIETKEINKYNCKFFSSSANFIIDAIFGSGINTAIKNPIDILIEKINLSNACIISIDQPSGLETWSSFEGPFVKANKTLCIGSVTPSVLNRLYLQDIEMIDIGLQNEKTKLLGTFIQSPVSDCFVAGLMPKTNRHAHKGMKGHSLLLGGNKGMSGAIVLSAVACSEIGAGNVTVGSIINTLNYIDHYPNIQFLETKLDGQSIDTIDFSKFNAIGIGPGLGTNANSLAFLSILLNTVRNIPMVIDADALNIIGQNKNLIPRIPTGSILTPHPKELSRVFGEFESQEVQWAYLSNLAKTMQIHILAKDTYSVLFCADGEIIVNGNGNETLAKGGSGDTLTGLITGLLSQGMSAKDAAIYGMYQLINYRH
jgi:ADP-dependent NAD(P)H-hydrate dehydratase / NAD(P)H-hydrate epimerase